VGTPSSITPPSAWPMYWWPPAFSDRNLETTLAKRDRGGESYAFVSSHYHIGNAHCALTTRSAETPNKTRGPLPQSAPTYLQQADTGSSSPPETHSTDAEEKFGHERRAFTDAV
jgi:hypothetical protein